MTDLKLLNFSGFLRTGCCTVSLVFRVTIVIPVLKRRWQLDVTERGETTRWRHRYINSPLLVRPPRSLSRFTLTVSVLLWHDKDLDFCRVCRGLLPLDTLVFDKGSVEDYRIVSEVIKYKILVFLRCKKKKTVLLVWS